MMRSIRFLVFAMTAAAALTGGVAYANTCKTEHLSCATQMPTDGYCQCTARGATEDGTVVTAASGHTNSTAGGCGANPSAPGCRGTTTPR